ncbi:MAG: type II secretion system protein GspD, partial [Desulfobulbus sp.]|nr:type II secretion system protein GspD [Desulfobulbus sp.]
MMRTLLLYSFSAVFFASCLLGGISPLFAAGPKITQQGGQAQRYVTIDFNDVDINIFIKYISELTGKNFIVDREVKGKVTIISPTRISEVDAYKVFESVLEVNGFAAVPSGSIIKIVPSVVARSKNIATLHDDDVSYGGDDRVVTQIVSLKHANAEEIKNMLIPLVSKTSVIISHAGSGMLILTDFQSNISRLMEIIRTVDVPSDGDEMLIIPLHRTSAESISKAIGQLFTGMPSQKGQRPEAVKVIPFERTNALIVVAPKASMERIRALVAKLDEDTPRKEGNLHVIYLQHANAEEMVKVLTNLPGDALGGKGMGGGTPGGTVSGSAISTEVKIVADSETNSLIITGPREEYEA